MSHSHGLCKARRFLADELKYVKAEVKFRLDNLEMSIAASGAEPSRLVDEMRGALMQMMEEPHRHEPSSLHYDIGPVTCRHIAIVVVRNI